MNSLLKKTVKLLEKPQGDINLIDIDYKLLEDPDDPYTTSTRSMVETNYNALLNSYRLWLQSKPGDYIRSKDTGGMFAYALNDKVQFLDSSIEEVKSLVVQKSNEMFPDLYIVDCSVKRVVADRNWDITIIVQDKLTDNVMTTELSVPATSEAQQ